MSRSRLHPRAILSATALTVALLGTACSDSTAPSTEKASGDGSPQVQLPTGTIAPDGTPAAPKDSTPAAKDTAAAPGDTTGTSAGLKPAFLKGDLTACRWSGNYCYRLLDVGYGANYPLYLVVEFNRGGSTAYAYIWIFDFAAKRYVERYAVGRADLSVWYMWGGQFVRYEPGIVKTGDKTEIINPVGQCGIEQLCALQMLEPNRVLPNGYTVASMLARLAYGL